MEAHLDQSLRMSRLSEISGFSESHLGTLFKQATGHSPMSHFHRLKMQAAARELAFTEKSVKEIGLACGIRDPYYFSRLFKSVMGVSPAKFGNGQWAEHEIRPLPCLSYILYQYLEVLMTVQTNARRCLPCRQRKTSVCTVETKTKHR